jgi:hypothetical protein
MVPPSGNALRRKYRWPHQYKRLRDEWGWSIKVSVATQDLRFLIRSVEKKQKATVRIQVMHKRLYDYDNLVSGCKPVVDSLVNLGLLAGDSPKQIDLCVTQIQSNVQQTVIEIDRT